MKYTDELPGLHQDTQSLQWFDCEETEYDLPHWLYQKSTVKDEKNNHYIPY